MSDTTVITPPVDLVGNTTGIDSPCQVILFNDNRNVAGYVVQCLCSVFGHNEQLAEKIMLEAHSKGRAIAEVEDQGNAQQHKNQLQSYGLTASVEKI